ncbi:MAG: type II toxin-antitoxin system death-on-curing family toxin [Pseudonocardiaceae bacterium]
MTDHITRDDLLVIAGDALGTPPLVRDHGLLEAALARPGATAFEEDAYPTIHAKAGALLHSLVTNHALVDGNKRLGWLACYVFLDVNGQELETTQDDAFTLVMAVADGSLSEVEKIAERLAAWCTPR